MTFTALIHEARGRAGGVCAQAAAKVSRIKALHNQRALRAPAEKTTALDVFTLSVPLFIELFMQIMMGNISQFMLSPLGEGAVAAAGNALQILNIITIALSAMGTASTILITRSLGKSSGEQVSHAAISQIAAIALVVNCTLATILTVVLFLFWQTFFTWLHIELALWADASSFLLIIGSSTLIQGAFFACTAFLRSYARTVDVMVVSLAMNLVNFIASFLLIGGFAAIPAFGIDGAAFASVGARIVGLAFIVVLVVKHTEIRMTLALIKPFPWKTLKRMLGVGIPSSGEQMNYDIAQIVILSFINVLGTTVVTVKVYCSMIASVAYLYSIALSQATQIVLGYLFGAQKYRTVRRRVWVADLIAMVLTTAVSVTLWLNASAVFGLFTSDPVVHELGKQVLFIEIFLGIGRALNIVMVRALIAVGDVKTPVSVNVVSSWIFAVAGGYVLGIGMGLGIVGMWIAMCIDEWLRAAFLLLTFARGRWHQRAVFATHAPKKPKEPAEPGVAALASLAMTDDGELAKTATTTVADALLSLW